MTTNITLNEERLAVLNTYLGFAKEARASFDDLAKARTAAIAAIAASCRDGDKVTVTKASLTDWLKAKGASELRPALVKRLWPDVSEKVTLKKTAVEKATTLAGEIAAAVEAVTSSKEERVAFFRELAKAVEAIVSSEE